jgi:hypothetical protein
MFQMGKWQETVNIRADGADSSTTFLRIQAARSWRPRQRLPGNMLVFGLQDLMLALQLCELCPPTGYEMLLTREQHTS